MAFYTFQLAKVAVQNIRSRNTDIDLVTFGVLVNGRDQGHGYAMSPMFPGYALTGQEITDGALLNGKPIGRQRMRADFTVGPVEVLDGDQVTIVYTATNTSDSQIPTADQQAVDQWTIKLTDIYYSLLLGEFVSGLGLKAITDFIGANLTSAAVSFLADPVGTLLGYKAPGPCNGTVYADKKEFTYATLASLPSTPSRLAVGTITIDSNWSELTQHYSDEATHNKETCGDTAQTDVTIRITKYSDYSLGYWQGFTHELSGGLRTIFPKGGSLKELVGLRI